MTAQVETKKPVNARFVAGSRVVLDQALSGTTLVTASADKNEASSGRPEGKDVDIDHIERSDKITISRNWAGRNAWAHVKVRKVNMAQKDKATYVTQIDVEIISYQRLRSIFGWIRGPMFAGNVISLTRERSQNAGLHFELVERVSKK